MLERSLRLKRLTDVEALMAAMVWSQRRVEGIGPAGHHVGQFFTQAKAVSQEQMEEQGLA